MDAQDRHFRAREAENGFVGPENATFGMRGPLGLLRVARDVTEALPLVGPLFGVARRTTREVADGAVHTVTGVVTGVTRIVLTSVVREVIDVLVREIDLTALVADNVDIDAIVATVDLDAAVARVDLDRAVSRVDLNAAVHRVDLLAVANEIIDGVDLAGIVRDASGTVSAEVIEDVRSGGERADDAVAAVVDRLLRRRPRRAFDGA